MTEGPEREISWKKIYNLLFKKDNLRLVCPDCGEDDSEDVDFQLQSRDFFTEYAGKR